MFGRTGLVPFARAAVPSQLAALTTRSSLATVPSLMLAAEQSLGLSPVVTASVIPLAGATLKLSRAVSNSTKFLFLAHVLGITLTPGQVAVFTATVLLMSPATPGVPSVASATEPPRVRRGGYPGRIRRAARGDHLDDGHAHDPSELDRLPRRGRPVDRVAGAARASSAEQSAPPLVTRRGVCRDEPAARLRQRRVSDGAE